MSSSYIDGDDAVEDDEVRALASARIRNQATAASLASVWRRRCERMTTDLERAQETYEEMKRGIIVSMNPMMGSLDLIRMINIGKFHDFRYFQKL